MLISKKGKIIKEFSNIGSHHVTNFINTIYTPNDIIIDNFENYNDIVQWFLENEIVSEINQVNEKIEKLYFTQIIKFRTTIRDVFMNNIELDSSLDKLVQMTNDILLENKIHPQIASNDNSFDLKFISNNQEQYNILLVQIAIEVIKLITSKDLKYLKKCNNHKCSLIFIDTSKNHSRRWCSMEVCGNRSKVNSFSKRKKELNK